MGWLILTLPEDNAAADTCNDLLSAGKVNTLLADKQECGVGKGETKLSVGKDAEANRKV